VFVTTYLGKSLNVKALAVVILKSVVKIKRMFLLLYWNGYLEKKILLGGNSIHV